MANYSPSTIAQVGELNPKRGLVCRTAVVNNTAVFTASSLVNIFKITGRVRIVSLDFEAITAFGAQASVPKWQLTGVTPVVAAFDISAVTASLSALAQGKRVMFAGTALNTAPVLDSVAGITLDPANTMDIGWDGGVCYIGLLGSTAQTSGTCQFTFCYLPQSDGAGVDALM